jgi:ankyrin repeat protein
MHGAGFQGRAEVAQLLIDHGVPVDAKHQDGHSPLQRACWGDEPRHTDTARVMMEGGASTEGINPGQNPGTQELFQKLKASGAKRKEL